MMNLMVSLERPRLRGVFHQYAFFVALVAGLVLVILADSFRERLAMWVYAVALAAMFGVSALYHRVTWRSPRVRRWMRRLDHSTILLLIAGTYTPFAVLTFDGVLANAILVVVWSGAGAGLLLNLLWVDAPTWVTAAVFMALGWVGVVTVPELVDVGIAPAVLVFVGGGLYSLGALAYALKRPNPRPAVFGYHEIFHLLVIAAAAIHFIAIAAFVLPAS
ncbi:MAG: hemolysin III family protein [Actinomycetota bacterium]|nr:hemolysin III family protein [Actinomycetota bacterium]